MAIVGAGNEIDVYSTIEALKSTKTGSSVQQYSSHERNRVKIEYSAAPAPKKLGAYIRIFDAGIYALLGTEL